MNEKETIEIAPKAKVFSTHMEALDHFKVPRQMVRDEINIEN